MPWDLDSDRSIFAQLVDRLQMHIISGQYKAGDKMPSVRELAAEAAVNPNTMQKAYAELERQGLVYSQTTSGRYVTNDNELIEKVRAEFARKEAEKYLARMQELGLGREDAIKLL